MPNRGRDIPGVHLEFTEAELRQLDGGWKSAMQLKVDRMDDRLRAVERMAYIGLGGLIVVGGIVTIYGQQILKVLSHA